MNRDGLELFRDALSVAGIELTDMSHHNGNGKRISLYPAEDMIPPEGVRSIDLHTYGYTRPHMVINALDAAGLHYRPEQPLPESNGENMPPLLKILGISSPQDDTYLMTFEDLNHRS
jgi:hypothetical protein